jgi:hypothetical protein
MHVWAPQTSRTDILLHPPCSSELSPSDFHLFIHWKDSMQGHHYMDGVTVQNAIHQQFQREEIDFRQTGVHAVVQIWKQTFVEDGDCIEINYVVLKLCEFLSCV